MVSKPDLGHQLTDEELTKLEKRIAVVYKQASEEMQGKVTAYFESFSKRDEEMKKLIGTVVNGKEWTEQDYKQWRLAQIGRGKRFEALRDKVAERMTKANEVAISYVNDATPGIYSLNRNYAAYTIEKVAGDVGFTLWDEQTVKRLIAEQPNLMPNYPKNRAIKRGIDLAYGKKQITAEVTSGILQGKSIKGLADGLQTRIPTMNRDSAIRTARTAVTGAQNAGRFDSYTAAQKMGIKLEKQWLATLDSRTRHSHAMLDGEHVGNDEKFSNGCRFPGDPQGPPREIYNCRCTLIAYLPDVDTSDAQRRARDSETGKSVLVEDMTYQEWAGWKQTQNYKNKYGEEIIFSLDEMSDTGKAETNKKIKILSSQYETGLREVQFNNKLGATKGKESGRVDVSGSIMEIARSDIVEHEFFHTLDSSKRAKYGDLDTSLGFWKDAKKLFSKYKKEANKNNSDIKISDYSTTNVDEFMAECFSVANGGTPADKFGVGESSPFVKMAMEIINKYYKKKSVL